MLIAKKIIIALVLFFTISTFLFFSYNAEDKIISHIVDLNESNLKLYWKDDANKNIHSFKSLKKFLSKKDETLVFAMNGGMYTTTFSPQGFYIENGEVLKEINQVQEAYGNFYMQPNGIFYITEDNIPFVISTKDYKAESVKYATQSGPMLLIDGELHSRFIEGSTNLNIRNGVGILPDNKILFAISKEKVNFYDFATYFKNQGCKNALYLDGLVSRVYDLENNITNQDGKFGVIIGESKNN